MPARIETVDELGLQGVLALAALRLAQDSRLLVTPTRRMTVQGMELLRDLGIIEVPWPAVRWLEIPGMRETPLEGLQWRDVWSVYEPQWLDETLADYLVQFPFHDLGQGLRLQLWFDLMHAESEHFFAQQLARHQLEPAWAVDLPFVVRDIRPGDLSGSQWRYCAWAAARHGAAVAMQSGGHSERVREATYGELRRRAIKVASGEWHGALSPGSATPASALARIFARQLTSLGRSYWDSPPAIHSLRTARIGP